MKAKIALLFLKACGLLLMVMGFILGMLNFIPQSSIILFLNTVMPKRDLPN